MPEKSNDDGSLVPTSLMYWYLRILRNFGCLLHNVTYTNLILVQSCICIVFCCDNCSQYMYICCVIILLGHVSAVCHYIWLHPGFWRCDLLWCSSRFWRWFHFSYFKFGKLMLLLRNWMLMTFFNLLVQSYADVWLWLPHGYLFRLYWSKSEEYIRMKSLLVEII